MSRHAVAALLVVVVVVVVSLSLLSLSFMEMSFVPGKVTAAAAAADAVLCHTAAFAAFLSTCRA